MTYPDFSNQRSHPSTESFNRLLAEYRSRVYEHYFSETNSLKKVAGELVKPIILVIEDNRDQWFLTRWALLQRFPKAQVQWLIKDHEVIPYLDTCRRREEGLPHMILVDLYLPGVQQGLNVLKALKSHPMYNPLPAVTLSWSNSVEDIAQAFDYLADGYLVKPTKYQDWKDGLDFLDRYWS
ncbi:response regulator [Spirosoma litoris]